MSRKTVWLLKHHECFDRDSTYVFTSKYKAEDFKEHLLKVKARAHPDDMTIWEAPIT
jgi:hypothetical protein